MNLGRLNTAAIIELGEYVCEVRSKQYSKLENLKSFDEFLTKRFHDSRRKAYYLMAIHENWSKIPKPRLREVGWSEAMDRVKAMRKGVLFISSYKILAKFCPMQRRN
jgi:hypothetical protein